MINIPVKDNKKLEKIMKRINSNKKIKAFFDCSNTMVVKRLGMTDHGPVHVSIVSNIALKLLRNLLRAGVIPSIVKDH